MKPWSVSSRLLIEFGIAFAVVLIARGTAIFSVTWAQDDFLQIYDPSGEGFVAAQFSMLRPSGSLAAMLVHWLGATQPTQGAFWNALHAGSMVVFGLALRHLWLPGSASICGVLTALIFALFPSQANLFSYNLMHPFMVMNYCLGAYVLVSFDKGGWRTLLSVIAVALALGYQTMLSLFLVAALFLVLFRLVPLADQRIGSKESLRRRLEPPIRLVVVLTCGVLLYFLGSKGLATLLSADPSGRAIPAGLESLMDKLSLVWAHLKRMAYGNGEPSLPVSVKRIQLLMLASGCGAWWLGSLRRFGRSATSLLRCLLLPCILIGAAVVILTPTILLAHTQVNPRNLMATSVFWAGTFCLTQLAPRLALRRAGLVLGSLLSVAYSIIANTISVEYARLTQRQLLLGSRIVERLSQNPAFSRLRTVVVVGSMPAVGKDLRSMDQVWSSLDSAFSPGLLREVSGEPFEVPTEADNEIARSAIRAMKDWPHPDSTAIVGDVGVVRLGAP